MIAHNIGMYVTQSRVLRRRPPHSEAEKTLTHHLPRNSAVAPLRSDQGEPKDSCMVLPYEHKKNGAAGVKEPIGHLSMAQARLLGCKADHLRSF
jgi:hypothetical protein